MTGTLHIIAATLALLAGLAVFGRPKGSRVHRRLGRWYAVLMVVANASALLTFEQTGEVGPFHVLAILSLATVVAGLGFLFARRPAGAWRGIHAYLMTWSWVGLLAAGLSQLATQGFPGRQGLTVLGTSLSVCAVAGWIIHTRMPRVLRALPSGVPAGSAQQGRIKEGTR